MIASLSLPVEDCLIDLSKAFENARSVILEAPPGAGKTTLVPLHFLSDGNLGDKKIIMLEPRRLAAKTAAQRMASLLGEKVGQTVGYRIKGDVKSGTKTRIEVVTEGILTRKIQSDPELSDIGLVIFDEFHERNLQSDLGLAFCLESQDVFREDLKVLIMSATLMGQNLEKILPNAPLIKSEGRQFPIEIRHVPRPTLYEMCDEVAKLTRKIILNETGSILVFLPGEGEIRRVENLLQDQLGSQNDILITPLFARMEGRDQDQAIQKAPEGFRKIVLATTIAETSLTIEGVRIVVDTGYKRTARYDENRSMNILETVRVSLSSADQRSGRAGRLEAGISYRMWPEEENRVLQKRDNPEILSTDLVPFAMELAAWGVQDPNDLRLLDKPNPAQTMNAQKLLQGFDILDSHLSLTSHGRFLQNIPAHPRFAHMITWAEKLSKSHQHLAVLLTSVLEDGSFHSKSGTNLEVDLKKTLQQKSSKAAKSFSSLSKRLNLTADNRAPFDQAGRLLAQAFPEKIAKLREGANTQYQLSNGKGCELSEGDKLSGEPFLVIGELGGKAANAKIYKALKVSEEDLLNDFNKQLVTKDIVNWNEQKNELIAKSSLCLFELELDSKPIKNPDEQTLSTCFCTYIKKKGLKVLNWSDEAKLLRNRILSLHHFMADAQEHFPFFDDKNLLEKLDEWLAPYLTKCRNHKDLQSLDLQEILKSTMDWSQNQRLDELVPTHFKVPSGSSKKINYEDPEHPALHTKLQEMFGSKETPTILNGKVSLRLHLLSPAGRPLQVTDDIAGFWETSYDSIKKEMKGRYPKHPWPDDPLNAIASAKTKRHIQKTSD